MKTDTPDKSPSQRTVLLGVTGSIAAYKACELVREWVRRKDVVHVIMTRNACEFVTPMTFQTLSQNPVTIGLFERKHDWRPRHISLAKTADVFVVAPATANVMAKMVHGLADDALTSAVLAFRGPVVVAPSMNDAMYDHPATVANVAALSARGVRIVEPTEGELACGVVARGRLVPIGDILSAVDAALGRSTSEGA